MVSIVTRIVLEGQPRDATMTNLSLGGALVETGHRHAMGARIELSFRIPTLEEPIQIGSTVRWLDADGVGLQFDGLRARDVWALNEYFKQLG